MSDLHTPKKAERWVVRVSRLMMLTNNHIPQNIHLDLQSLIIRFGESDELRQDKTPSLVCESILFLILNQREVVQGQKALLPDCRFWWNKRT
jgi:hypothetical protein